METTKSRLLKSKIRRMAAAGMNSRNISDRLNEEGITNTRGNKFSVSLVCHYMPSHRKTKRSKCKTANKTSRDSTICSSVESFIKEIIASKTINAENKVKFIDMVLNA